MQEGLLSCSIKSLNVNFDKSSTTLEKRVTSDRLVNLFNDGQAGNFRFENGKGQPMRFLTHS
jgi:hypothetical protein